MSLPTGFLSAAEFCIENEVSIGEGNAAVKSTSFLFNGGFTGIIGGNGEITLFDAKTQVFTLLDPVLRIQTQVDGAETKKSVEQRREQILTRTDVDKNSFLYFAAKPKFLTEEYDAVSGGLALQSPWLAYDLKTAPLPDAQTAKQYFDFCDWNCYLNLRLNPQSASMLVRREVDRILQEKNRFAAGVTMTIFQGRGLIKKPEYARSTHTLVMRLDDTAKKRIGQVWEYKRTFPQVPFAEYQQKVAEREPRR